MAARWYADRPVLLVTAAGLAGAVAGWLARSKVARRRTGASARTTPSGRWPTGEPIPATPVGSARSGRAPTVPPAPEAARDPSPLPQPVPLPEGTAVDAPYTDEEPYTGRPRYASRRGTDVPGGTPP